MPPTHQAISVGRESREMGDCVEPLPATLLSSLGLFMRQYKLINTAADGIVMAIRACYGKCGFDSIFRTTGHGITGVMIIDETR